MTIYLSIKWKRSPTKIIITYANKNVFLEIFIVTYDAKIIIHGIFSGLLINIFIVNVFNKLLPYIELKQLKHLVKFH